MLQCLTRSDQLVVIESRANVFDGGVRQCMSYKLLTSTCVQLLVVTSI